ncbi:TPR-like protein [Calocera viscosa TUFC12733]|uniref:TPR-like protein n=1 Tax=Calocera viscosa (strain TUFC12733) TaxID=1330018 RepID=A0A167HQB8_CALVF|nr:TPR-like protein [Calocera viscosa TUFC12733]
MAWITEQILNRIPLKGKYDETTFEVVDSLAKMCDKVDHAIKRHDSSSTGALGAIRQMTTPQSIQKLHQELDALTLRFTVAHTMHVGEQVEKMRSMTAGVYSEQVHDALQLQGRVSPQPRGTREMVIADIIRLLSSEGPARVSLLGTGGIGKTSLASAVLNDPRIKNKYGQRTLFANCAGLASAEGIIEALAASLGLRHDSDSDARQTVFDYLSSRSQTLLVLENLDSKCPPPGVNWDATYLQPAEKLTLDAARQVWSSIAPTGDGNLDQLLSRLDGQPLAIHLLAHQGRRLSPTNILAAYQKEEARLKKLDDGAQLTSLEMSMLLSLQSDAVTQDPHAQELLPILSLLPDGVPMEALRQMLPSMSSTITTTATVLLQAALAFEDRGRLRISSPIRDFVLSRDRPTGSSLQEVRHHFMNLAQQVGEIDLRTKEVVEVLATEFGNINSVLMNSWEESHDGQDANEMLEATERLSEFSYLTNYGDCIPLLERAKTSLASTDNWLSAARCMWRVGVMLRIRRRNREAFAVLQKAQAAFDALGDRLGAAQCKQTLGDILYAQHRYSAATSLLNEAGVEYERRGDILGAAQCKQSIGNVLRMQHRYAEAISTLEEAKASFSGIGNWHRVAQCTQSLGNILRIQEQYGEAIPMLEDAKTSLEAIGDTLGAAQCTRSLGDALYMQGHYDAAAGTLEEARTAFEAVDDLLGVAQCQKRISDVLRMQAQYEAAISKLEEAKVNFEAIGDRHGKAQCTQSLGNIFRMQGQYDRAVPLLRDSMVAFKTIGNIFNAAHCARSLGDVLRMEARYDTAVRMLQEAKAVFGELGERLEVARCNQLLAATYFAANRREQAEAVMRQAVEIYEDVGSAEEEAEECRVALTKLRSNLRKRDKTKARLSLH